MELNIRSCAYDHRAEASLFRLSWHYTVFPPISMIHVLVLFKDNALFCYIAVLLCIQYLGIQDCSAYCIFSYYRQYLFTYIFLCGITWSKVRQMF